MDFSSIWIMLIIAFVAGSLVQRFTSKKKKNLPPGPREVPILGHIHLLGKNPHIDLYELAKKHGPIMYLRLGLVPHVVVSSAKAAELFLKTNDLIFASRAPFQAAKHLTWDQRSMAFSPYGTYWRNMRKLVTLELLSSVKINSFQPMRREELSLFIESLKVSARDHASVDLSEGITMLNAQVSFRMVFGKMYKEKGIDERGGFRNVVHEGMQYIALPNLGDYFPFLAILDLQGLTRKMRALSKVVNSLFDTIIDDHIRCGGDQQQTKDLVDSLISIMQSEDKEFKFDRRNVKAMMLDMLIGSMDTIAATVEWVISDIIRHPRIMKKLQKEIEQVVGLDRMVEESDLDKLEYLYMIVKESFRVNPGGPLLIPHYSMEDCTIDGYDIPKGSKVLINIYSIGRDPNTWTDPESFVPERFEGNDIDLKGKHFELLPFGSGRRGCPGMQLGLIQLRLIVAQLVHCFDWQLPDGISPSDLDMTGQFGLAVTRASHLIAIPTYRLRI